MSGSTRILAMSDLNWTKRGTSVEQLMTLVQNTQPDLVLLAGDIVDNDKGKTESKCPPCWQEMGKFLNFLESSAIQCYIVRGNWDEKPIFNEVVSRGYTYIEDISNKRVEFRGIKLWGIPHNLTTRKIDLPPKDQAEPVDILLTHADGTRRMMLFEYPARLIITGHYDEKLSVIRQKAFVSFSQFPNQYAVIDYTPNDISIRYLYNERFRIQAEPTFYNLQLHNGIATWNTQQAENQAVTYAHQMEGLLSLKEREAQLIPQEKQEAVNHLVSIGVPKAQIIEHIPGAAPLLKPPKKTSAR